jgi:pimeloyl-ACP methyl ester carboxylesterase
METGYFRRPEGTLAYSDYGGSGELALMLPGMGALRDEYRYLAPQLRAAGFRAVSADLRGHGDSSVPWEIYDVPAVGGDILGLVEHLGVGAAHVVATSFSAGAAVWAAAERPERVRSLALIGAFVRDVQLGPFLRAGAWLMMNNPWRVQAWLWYYRTLYPTRKPLDFSHYLARLKEKLTEPGRFEAARALANSSRHPSEERLPRVTAPTLVIMGSKDRDFPDPAAEGRFVAEQTGGRLELIEAAGHYPQTEFPEVTGPLVTGFLRALGAVPALRGEGPPGAGARGQSRKVAG